MKPEIKKLEKSRVEITSSIPADKLETYRDRAIAQLAPYVKIDGFREGKVPAAMIEKQVGDMGVLEQMAQLAISDVIADLIVEAKVDAIGRPEIHIKKIAKGNDLEFSVILSTLPEVTLGDYKKVAKSANKESTKVEITDEELENSIKELRQMRAHHMMHENGEDHHDHNHANIPDEKLPALDDEFVNTRRIRECRGFQNEIAREHDC